MKNASSFLISTPQDYFDLNTIFWDTFGAKNQRHHNNPNPKMGKLF
jgi:hypothetical protein